MSATKKNIYFLSRNEELQLEGRLEIPGGGALKGSVGRGVPPRPSNPDSV